MENFDEGDIRVPRKVEGVQIIQQLLNQRVSNMSMKKPDNAAVENNSRLTLSPPIFPTSKPQVSNDSIILSATFKSFHDDFESVKQESTLITKKNPLELHELIMISLCQGLENQGFMNLRACQTRDHQWNHLRQIGLWSDKYYVGDDLSFEGSHPLQSYYPRRRQLSRPLKPHPTNQYRKTFRSYYPRRIMWDNQWKEPLRFTTTPQESRSIRPYDVILDNRATMEEESEWQPIYK